MSDTQYYVLMALHILVIVGWCGVIGYCIYDRVTHDRTIHCTCEEAP